MLQSYHLVPEIFEVVLPDLKLCSGYFQICLLFRQLFLNLKKKTIFTCGTQVLKQRFQNQILIPPPAPPLKLPPKMQKKERVGLFQRT